ncbi:MAG: signal peptidase II [Elusimicrobiales bacterium]|nr:signal peptidase II [Elusimicrobiales bacterium]
MNKKLLSPLIILSIFALDRISKYFVLKFILPESFSVCGFLDFVYVENTGVAFGMFQNANSFFIVLTLVLLSMIMVFRRKIEPCGILVAIGIAMVVGGALGNLYDRIVYGYVIDFVNLSFFPAVFNVADSSISVGAVLIALKMRKTQKSNM